MENEANPFVDGIGSLSEKETIGPKHQVDIGDKINTILVQNRIESLKTNGNPLQKINNIVNFAENIHAIHHHASCFKYSSECHYNYPALPNETTSIDPTGGSMTWWNWDGSSSTRTLFEITPKHGLFDVFANTFCQVISDSNLMCNSNMQILVPGPHAMYVTKYATKPNKIEESGDFEYTTKKMEIKLSERRKDTDLSEGFNIVITDLFIHNH